MANSPIPPRKAAALSAEPMYFADAAAFRARLGTIAATATELIVGFMKKDTGVASISWPEAVDEALCFGWIDGVRHRIDDERYKIRFTPRRADSHWSAVNIKRVAELQAEKRMTPAGEAAFALRKESRSAKAAYEQDAMPELSAAYIAQLKQHTQAWDYFSTLPPWYLKKVIWWVVSAKQVSTQEKRLHSLIQACAVKKRL